MKRDEAEDIEYGSIVKLLAGGPDMIISTKMIHEDRVMLDCKWFSDNHELQEHSFFHYEVKQAPKTFFGEKGDSGI